MPKKKGNASSIEALVGSIMTGGQTASTQTAEGTQQSVQGVEGTGTPPAAQNVQEPEQKLMPRPVKAPAKVSKADAVRKVRCTIHLEVEVDKALDLRCARADGLTRSECINALLREELDDELKMLDKFASMMQN